MDPVAGLGATATLVATAFALCTLERYRSRRRPHELAWTVSLTMFAVASLAYAWGAGLGWTPLSFRAFYLFGAILNVPYLALGTVYLLGGTRLGNAVRRPLDLVSALAAGVLSAAPLRSELPRDGLPSGREVFGVLPRIMAAVGSGVGATVLIVGAVWSAVRLLRSRRRADADAAAGPVGPGRLALTNTLIAVGSLVLGVGGAGFTGRDALVSFGVFLTAGIVVLFAGFLISTPHRAPTLPADVTLLRPAGSDRAFLDELREIAGHG